MEDNGQINKTEELVLKDIFSNSPLNLYIFKKTNKLSIASYLLTEHIKDIEPLKWSIRKISVQLLEGVVSFKGLNKTEVSSFLLSLRSYFETAFLTKLVSKNNAEIMIQEIDKLAQEIGSFDSSKDSEKVLSQNFFSVEKPAFIATEKLIEDIKKDSAVFNRNSDFSSKGHQNYKGQIQTAGTKSFRNEEEDKRQRRNKILSIIKQKKEVTIKDISSNIKDCSEKTIQRELNALLSERVIKKTGERRWSKYLLS